MQVAVLRDLGDEGGFRLVQAVKIGLLDQVIGGKGGVFRVDTVSGLVQKRRTFEQDPFLAADAVDLFELFEQKHRVFPYPFRVGEVHPPARAHFPGAGKGTVPFLCLEPGLLRGQQHLAGQDVHQAQAGGEDGRRHRKIHHALVDHQHGQELVGRLLGDGRLIRDDAGRQVLDGFVQALERVPGDAECPVFLRRSA